MDIDSFSDICRSRLTAVASLCIAMLWLTSGAAAAQSIDDSVQLQASPRLREQLSSAERSQMPVFLEGDQLTSQSANTTVVTGHAQLRRADTMIRADRLEYREPTDTAFAQGNVHINRAGNVFDGQELQMQLDSHEGYFKDGNYRLLLNNAYGVASQVDFIDQNRSLVHQGTYTTCQRTDEASWQPDWVIRADKIHIDTLEEVGVAENAVLEFKGVPMLPVPRISFPLSDKRKSGLLPPTFTLDSNSGFSYAQPYYWNIAPNRDATITPSVMTKRGAALAGEFRYLEPSYSGLLAALYMPSDKLRERDRWSYVLQHNQSLDSPIGGLGLNLNLKRVSDGYYWQDFMRNNYRLNERLLSSDGTLNWSRGDQSLLLRAQSWQTLQDPLSPLIVPPYGRLPQLQYRYTPRNLAYGLEAKLETDFTRFRADSLLTGQSNAERAYVQGEISRPFIAPQGYITPKIMFNARTYRFDDSSLTQGLSSKSVALPTFSLDSGLVFERNTNLFGRNLIQTLEPRAFYTYTPYRDQSMIPVYDTALYDFSFATIYNENAFSGYDRISDTNMLTVGATTRFLDADSGAEAARFSVAQRLRFRDQLVTMPGATPDTTSGRWSDIMLGAGINWTPLWGFDTTVQYSPEISRSIRSTVAVRYKPGQYKALSLAYRYQRADTTQTTNSEQIDVGWQWPLDALMGGGSRKTGEGRWYTVGRLNYSRVDRRFVDSLAGVEYSSCCWSTRVVLERLQTNLVQANTRLLFQIEFRGLSRLALGADPLISLRDNVPGYQPLTRDSSPASRFSSYD